MIPMLSKKFLVAIRSIEHDEEELVWKIPKVSKTGKKFKDPYVYVRPWSIPEDTGILLYEEVAKRKSKNILELGTSTGYSTAFLAQAASLHDRHVYTIERFKEKVERATENFKRLGFEDRITLYDRDIRSTLRNWNANIKVDFMFMDADKQYYTDYFKLIEPHLAENVFIIVDNAGNYADRMKQFFLFLQERKNEWKTTFLEQDNGLLLIERNED